jgi:hypothetical protein
MTPEEAARLFVESINKPILDKMDELIAIVKTANEASVAAVKSTASLSEVVKQLKAQVDALPTAPPPSGPPPSSPPPSSPPPSSPPPTSPPPADPRVTTRPKFAAEAATTVKVGQTVNRVPGVYPGGLGIAGFRYRNGKLLGIEGQGVGYKFVAEDMGAEMEFEEEVKPTTGATFKIKSEKYIPGGVPAVTISGKAQL